MTLLTSRVRSTDFDEGAPLPNDNLMKPSLFGSRPWDVRPLARPVNNNERDCGNRRMAAETHFGKRTPEQHYAEMLDAQEFHQIKKFVAACRRQWPGAMIVLRPDSAPTGANAPPNLDLAPGETENF